MFYSEGPQVLIYLLFIYCLKQTIIYYLFFKIYLFIV